MKARAAVLAVICTASVAYAESDSFNTSPDDSDIRFELDASRLPTVRATIHSTIGASKPVMLHVSGGPGGFGAVEAAGVWPIGEGDVPLAIAFVVDERIRGDLGAAFDRFLPIRVPPGSQLMIVSYGSSPTVVAPLQPVEVVHGAAFGANVPGAPDAPHDPTLAIRTAVRQLRQVPGAIPRVSVIDAVSHTVPDWHEQADDAEVFVHAPDYGNDPVSTLDHELHFLDPMYAEFDIRALGVFDGQPHTYWITMGDFATQKRTLAFSRDGKLIPATRHAVTTDTPSTPDWQVALLALAQLAMLVIAYRVALRESPPAPRERPSQQ